MIPASVKNLEGTEFFLDTDIHIRIIEVEDFVPAERDVNIPNSFAVVRAVSPDVECGVFIIFDNGAVQNDGGTTLGYWHDCPLIDRS